MMEEANGVEIDEFSISQIRLKYYEKLVKKQWINICQHIFVRTSVSRSWNFTVITRWRRLMITTPHYYCYDTDPSILELSSVDSLRRPLLF